MSTSVKHIHSGMRGAPQISGQAGTLLAVLNALFSTGWGATTAVSVSVSGGIATAMLNAGESFDRDAVVLVSGATPSAINGEARVKTTSNTSITWETTAPDGVATGTITVKYAPQTSWVKAFSKTNVEAWRSTHVQASGHYLRVDDTGTTVARVRGYESMTDIDTGTGPFPTEAQIAGGGYWHKSTQASAVAAKYRIFCDERFVVVAIAAGVPGGANQRSAPARGFGDPLALSPSGDAWSTILTYSGAVSSPTTAGSLDSAFASGSNGGCAFARSVAGIGGAALADVKVFTGSLSTLSGSDSALGAFPSAVDGGLYHGRTFLTEQSAGSPPRAITPGVYNIPQSGVLALLSDGDTLDGTMALAGRRLVGTAIASGYSGTPSGMYLVDITGPWR